MKIMSKIIETKIMRNHGSTQVFLDSMNRRAFLGTSTGLGSMALSSLVNPSAFADPPSTAEKYERESHDGARYRIVDYCGDVHIYPPVEIDHKV